ncbi:unnamed protein product, partial [Prunus brigantina]
MSDMEEVLERQEREIRERRHRRAASKRAQRDLDQQLVMASSRGSHEGRAPNVDRHRHSRIKNLMEDYFIPTSLDYLRRPTPRDLQRLLQKAERRGFPGMIG